MTSESNPTAADDERAHADSPAEGEAPGGEPDGTDAREHPTDPAEGPDDV